MLDVFELFLGVKVGGVFDLGDVLRGGVGMVLKLNGFREEEVFEGVGFDLLVC